MKKFYRFLCSFLAISMLIILCPIPTGENNGIILTANADGISKPDFSVNSGDGCVTLVWKPVKNAEKYYVCCFLEDKKIESKYTKETSIVIDNLKNEKEYKFLVCTVKDSQKSAYTDSDWIYATPNGGKVTELKKPVVTLSQSSTKSYTVNVRWGRVANADSYSIYYKKDGDKKYTKAATVNKAQYALEVPTHGKYIIRINAIHKNDDGTKITSTSESKKITVKSPTLSPDEFENVMNLVLSEYFGNVKIECDENTSKNNPFDVWIRVISPNFVLDLYDYENSIKLTKKEKQDIIDKYVLLQYMIYQCVEDYMPGKKVECSMYYGYYKYPNLKVGYQSVKAFTWINYSMKNEYSWQYSDSKYTGKMTWYTVLDDYDLPLTKSDITNAEKKV